MTVKIGSLDTSKNISLCSKLIYWRRKFHKSPEPGWCEFKTASTVVVELKELGYTLHYGKKIFGCNERMGVPEESLLNSFFDEALSADDSDTDLLFTMQGGYTAVVGVLENGEGPTVMIRFDMDALSLTESSNKNHLPNIKNFSSDRVGIMHACGHDAHTSIGLGVATLLANMKQKLKGRVVLVFQPAEEGVRGASALVDNPMFNKIDYALGVHLWSDMPKGRLICGTDGQMATSKFDLVVSGKASHAGLNPEDGIDAMLPAAKIVIALNSLRFNFTDDQKLNIGTLNAGESRNIICPKAILCIETRALNSKDNIILYDRVISTIEEVLFDSKCSYQIVDMGYADGADSNLELARDVKSIAVNIPFFTDIIEKDSAGGNSEDFTVFMNKVHSYGAKATAIGVGASCGAGAHHTEDFDIDESVMPFVVDLLVNNSLYLMHKVVS